MDINFEAKLGGKDTAIIGSIKVKAGDNINANDILLKVENGKINQMIKAKTDGIVDEVCVKEGDEVKLGTVLVKIKTGLNQNVHAETEKVKIMEKEEHTDIVIIGGGPGGYVAALYAAKFNKHIIVIEENKVGGTCLNRGCIPTKTLVTASENYHTCKSTEEYGIHCSNITLNMREVIQKKNTVVETLTGGIQSLLSSNNIKVINGKATFTDSKTIQVMDDSYTYKISATHIIIATGSKTAKLPIPGLDKSAILDSTSILDMVELPKSLTIIGGGVIGMEFAFIYANFGVKVNVVEYLDKILVNLDDDLIERIEHAAKEKNISLYTGAKVKEIKESVQNEMITVFEEEGQEKYIISEKILAAVGRIPNIDGLNVENINIRLNENGKGIMVNDKMQTNVEHIYAIGDVNNKIQLAHAASNQGMIAIDAIIGKNRSLKELSLVPSVIFTTPEVAMVGKTEKQLKKDNHTYKVSKFPYATNGKALSMSKTEGFIKLIYDDTEEKLCGAAIVGEDASNLISSLCIAVQNNLTVEQLSDVIYPHPTLGEMLQEAALGLTIGAIHSHE